MCLSNILQLVSTGALIITIGVLIWYAWETRGLRKETVRQTELSQRPYVILIRASFGTQRLNFENIGLSHALDVSIDILKMNTFFYRFQPCHLVKHGKKEAVRALPFGKDEKSEKMVKRLGPNLDFPFFKGLKDFSFFKGRENVQDYPLTVRYKNIEGTPYYTQLEVRVKERRVIIKGSDKDKEPPS